MIDLFGTRPKPPTAETARVKGWVAESFGLPEDVVVMVTELRCTEADCPDVETVIAVLGGPGAARRHKILKPLADVTRADVAELAARGTHG